MSPVLRSLRVALLCLCVVPLARVAAETPVPRLDVNAADAGELAAALPGIGAVKAAAIVAHREAHGPFESPEALLAVKGIGPKTLERLRPLLTVGPAREASHRAQEERTRAAVQRVIVGARERGSTARVLRVR